MTTGGWGWKLATDPDDVMNFLNGCNGYEHPVKDAHITAMWNGTYSAFHVFYQPGDPGQPPGSWGWKKATDPDDAMAFLNGTGAYCLAPEKSRLAALWKDSYPEFYVFYTYPLVPARIINCEVLDVIHGAFPKVRLGWASCEGEPPQKITLTIYKSVGTRWENVMPRGEPCVIARPQTTNGADVLLGKLAKGTHKISFCAAYANHDEIEYNFDRVF